MNYYQNRQYNGGKTTTLNFLTGVMTVKLVIPIKTAYKGIWEKVIKTLSERLKGSKCLCHTSTTLPKATKELLGQVPVTPMLKTRSYFVLEMGQVVHNVTSANAIEANLSATIKSTYDFIRNTVEKSVEKGMRNLITLLSQ